MGCGVRHHCRPTDGVGEPARHAAGDIRGAFGNRTRLQGVGQPQLGFVMWLVLACIVLLWRMDRNREKLTEELQSIKAELRSETVAASVEELVTKVSEMEEHVTDELASNISSLEDRISDTLDGTE